MALFRPLALLLALGLPGGAAAASLPQGAPGSRAQAPTKPAAGKVVASAKTTPRAGSKASGASRAATAPAKKAPRWPAVVLFHINTKEKLALRVADDRGRPVPGVQKRMNRFLRCHHTQAQARIHPRLVRLIYETGRSFPGRRIDVVSGYRHPKVAKNPRSPHKKGFACDLRVEGVKNAELRDFLRSKFQGIGVGYYPNSSFVHLDVRDGASAFWIDYSGPGEGAMYAEDPRIDLASGRAESFRPAKIDLSWADEPEPAEDTDPPATPSGTSEPESSASTTAPLGAQLSDDR